MALSCRHVYDIQHTNPRVTSFGNDNRRVTLLPPLTQQSPRLRPMKLIRRFTPLNMLFLSVNGMIGSAWLFAPLYAAKIAGSGALIAWIIGGIATIIIAMTFAETSILIPSAGGSFQIPQISHGEFTSFIMSWITWLSCVTMVPIEVQAVLQYASIYFHSLTHIVNHIPVLTATGLSWAVIIMLGLSIINVASFKGLVGFNRVLFCFKVAVMVLTCIWLVKTSFHGGNFAAFNSMHQAQAGMGINWKEILTAVASGGVAFAFTGFKHGVELAGETTNSRLAIPLAIIGSIAICLLLYFGLQTAFIGAVSPDTIKSGWGALTFAGDVGPFVGIAAALGLVFLVKLLYVDAVISPLGAGLIYVTSTSRVIYAMSKNQHIPPIFSRLNNKNFPIWAIGLNFVVGLFLFLPLPGWQNMVSFLVSAVVISYTMGPISLLCFRQKLADENRAFTLPGANALCFLAFYACNMMFYWTGWETVSKLAIALFIGVALFIYSSWRRKMPLQQLGMKAALWLVPYLAGLTLISYLGSFGGGKQYISFGWDFLIIGIFSMITLYLALTTSSANVWEKYQVYKNSETFD
jgi:amino acid transporter